MTADDGFIVQFRMRNGCIGTLQSTCSDRSPPMIETRVTGTRGTAWIRGVGSQVFIADADGTRKVVIDDDLLGGEIEPPPEGALETEYEQMIGIGLDIAPYTRLAQSFRTLIEGSPLPSGSQPARLDDGIAALRVLEAARHSARERIWVEP